MSKLRFEYIWLDGGSADVKTQYLRSKTKVIDSSKFKKFPEISHTDLPDWSFDGSSTRQAKGNFSDCILRPVRVCTDPVWDNGYLVMCEVFTPDGKPHNTNTRAKIQKKDKEFWFGFEQEYAFWDMGHNSPLGVPAGHYPAPQGPYYCSVGAEYAVGRHIADQHLQLCIKAGLGIEGVNAEVMKGQWEYQIFAKGAREAGDQVWLARYIMERIGEEYGVRINLDPKPFKGDWNGSGMHCNFSNTAIRAAGGKVKELGKYCKLFKSKKVIKRAIALYGVGNEERLTGKHETQDINTFSYGVSDRGASIRIPVGALEKGKGWLEDRRPASNANPYNVAGFIVNTVRGKYA